MQAFLGAFNEQHLAIVYDDLLPRKQAVLVTTASDITSDTVNQLLHLGKGIIFVAVSSKRCQELLLAPMQRPTLSPPSKQTQLNTINPRICLSVESREGVTTGISAADRAVTIGVLGANHPNARDLVSPGHIFPVETCAGGVLAKSALPEAALDITQLTSPSQAAAYVDLLDSDGEFLSIDKAFELAESLSLPIISLTELVRYRLTNTILIERIAEAQLPTSEGGLLKSIVYRCKIDGSEHFALIKGDIDKNNPVLTRVQVDNPLSDVFGGGEFTSRQSIKQSLSDIQEKGVGVFVYLRRSASYSLSDQCHPPQNPDGSHLLMRDYGIGAQILRDLKIHQVELLYNHTRTMAGLQSFGIEIVKHQKLFK